MIHEKTWVVPFGDPFIGGCAPKQVRVDAEDNAWTERFGLWIQNTHEKATNSPSISHLRGCWFRWMAARFVPEGCLEVGTLLFVSTSVCRVLGGCDFQFCSCCRPLCACAEGYHVVHPVLEKKATGLMCILDWEGLVVGFICSPMYVVGCACVGGCALATLAGLRAVFRVRSHSGSHTFILLAA